LSSKTKRRAVQSGGMLLHSFSAPFSSLVSLKSLSLISYTCTMYIKYYMCDARRDVWFKQVQYGAAEIRWHMFVAGARPKSFYADRDGRGAAIIRRRRRRLWLSRHDTYASVRHLLYTPDSSTYIYIIYCTIALFCIDRCSLSCVYKTIKKNIYKINKSLFFPDAVCCRLCYVLRFIYIIKKKNTSSILLYTRVSVCACA